MTNERETEKEFFKFVVRFPLSWQHKIGRKMLNEGYITYAEIMRHLIREWLFCPTQNTK